MLDKLGLVRCLLFTNATSLVVKQDKLNNITILQV